MAELHILTKTEKVDKAGAIYWEVETNTGKHRAWERNNKEGLEIGSWYNCEITQQGNFLPQIQQSTHIDPPPTGGVQDMMAPPSPDNRDGAVPPEVWEANHRGEDMRSAIHAVASICQAFAQGVVIIDLPGGTPDGRSLEVFPLIKAFYDLIQDARNGTFLVPEVHIVRIPVPELDIPALRKQIWGDDLEAFKAWAEPKGYLGPNKKGVPPEKAEEVKKALQALIRELVNVD